MYLILSIYCILDSCIPLKFLYEASRHKPAFIMSNQVQRKKFMQSILLLVNNWENVVFVFKSLRDEYRMGIFWEGGGGVFSSIVALSLCCSPYSFGFFLFFSGKIINILKAKVISSDIWCSKYASTPFYFDML